MPTYRMRCSNEKCDQIFENYKCLMEERNNVICPKCGEKMKLIPVLCELIATENKFTGIKDE